MFIRGTRLTVPVDKVEAAIEHFRDETAPKAKEVNGNRGAVLIIDRSTGDGWGITYWEDRAALDASEEAGSGLRSRVVEQFGATIHEVDRLEVLIQERTAPPRSGTFVRVNDAKGDPARIDDSVRIARDSALPRLRGMKGFRALISAVNRETGRGLTTTVWDTLEDLRASEAAAAPVRKEAIEAAGATSVDVHVYEAAYVDITIPVTQA